MVSATGAASGAAGSTMQSAMNSQLDKNAFLSLLITQLRNQDPLKPMEDTQFIAQLAQFSSLEQMQTVNKNLETLGDGQTSTQALSVVQQAVSLIGRNVEIANPEYHVGSDDIPQTIKLKVESVDLRTGEPILKVGEDKYITLNSVLSVS